MRALSIKDKWILVTGASSGLGKELAVQLARDYHANMIIVARRTQQLEVLKQELESQYKIGVKVLTADLSKEEDAQRVFDFSTKEVCLHGVILNAGVTYFGRDRDITDENRDGIIRTNIVSAAFLIQRFAKYFDERGGESGMLLVSSMAAVSPAPYQALYSGSKAFLSAYGQALSEELTNRQFSISVFAPGGIRTEMTADGRFDDLQKWMMSSSDVAKIALKGFVRRKLFIIPGLSNKLGSIFFVFLPKKFLLKQLGNVYRKALASAAIKSDCQNIVKKNKEK